MVKKKHIWLTFLWKMRTDILQPEFIHFLKSYETPTHIYVTQQIVEATVAVVGGAAESLEDAEPLGTQGATIRRQLRTQDPDIVHPGSAFT